MRLSTFEAYYKQRAVSGSQQRSQQATLETTQGPHASLREAGGIDFIRRARSTHGTAHLVRITSRADLRAAARAMALLASCSWREALGLEARAALPRPRLPGRAPRPPGGGGPLLPEGLGPEALERSPPRLEGRRSPRGTASRSAARKGAGSLPSLGGAVQPQLFSCATASSPSLKSSRSRSGAEHCVRAELSPLDSGCAALPVPFSTGAASSP